MIVFALLILTLIVIIALVIDIGMLRADRKSNKSTSDHATAAGVLALEDELAGDGRPHPWRGVCEAYRYVKANGIELESFDAGSEEWSDQSSPPVVLAPGIDPCTDPTYLGTPCVPGVLQTYARFRGEADDGRIMVEIRSGYAMPDPAFPEDSTLRNGDNGDPAEQGCDNLSVVIHESQPRGFSAVIGDDDLETRVRTVGRVTLGSGFDAPVSLLLLERRACRALRVEGTNSRVIVEHSDDDGTGPGTDGMWPGLIHADSDGSLCSDGQSVLEGLAGSQGPAIVARNATIAHPTVNAILPAQIGVFAKFFAGRPAHTPYPTTIGDTDPVAAQRQGRRRVDDKYLSGIRSFATEAANLVGLSTPPTTEWSVFQGSQCTLTDGVLPAPTFTGTAPNKLWFNCPELLVRTLPLTLTTPDLDIVITGRLQVSSPFEIHDLRKLWLRGQTSGPQFGIRTTSNLRLNTGGTTGPSTSPCPVDAEGETVEGKTASIYVGNGPFDLGSGGTFRACSTFMLLKGGASLPAVPGTTPVPSCAAVGAASTGTFKTSSGAIVEEWTAPNEIADVQPTPEFMATHRFEDLSLWTEASDPSVLAGGAATVVKGVFFLPNANDFTITGNADDEMPASAQFIACRVRATGGGTLKMVPDAFNFVLVPSFVGFELVR